MVREIDRETTLLLPQQKADQDLGWLNWINALKHEERMQERGRTGAEESGKRAIENAVPGGWEGC